MLTVAISSKPYDELLARELRGNGHVVFPMSGDPAARISLIMNCDLLIIDLDSERKSFANELFEAGFAMGKGVEVIFYGNKPPGSMYPSRLQVVAGPRFGWVRTRDEVIAAIGRSSVVFGDN